ncbi:hypothetical protein Trydic_g19442 [Trypoxylus dichotomus]
MSAEGGPENIKSTKKYAVNILKNLNQIVEGMESRLNKKGKGKYQTQEDTIEKLKGDLWKLEGENAELEKKCISLQIKNEYLERQLEHEKQNGDKLRVKPTDNQTTINHWRHAIHVKNIDELENKIDPVLPQRKTSDELMDALFELFQRFVSVNEVVLAETKSLTEEIKTQNWEENDTRLANLRSACERCDVDLGDRGIIMNSRFMNLLEDYTALRNGNRSSAKDTLKAIYEIAKLTGGMRQRWEAFVDHLVDDLAALEKFEKKPFPATSSLKPDFELEARMYDELLVTGQEEIACRKEILRVLNLRNYSNPDSL